jgi:hypothetical protein
MTAKEKAEKLVDKMKLKKDVIDENNYWSSNEFGAKECALICVDEVIDDRYKRGQINFVYWKEVKEEIIKL